MCAERRMHGFRGLGAGNRVWLPDYDLRGMGLFSLVYHSWGERHETDH